METKKTSSRKVDKKRIFDVEQAESSSIETTNDYELPEISDEKTKLLGGVSTGARPKTIATETFVKIADSSSASSSPDAPDYSKSAEAALQAAESARKTVFSCRCITESATIAICEGEARLNAAEKSAETVHHSHVPHYLGLVNKYRTIVNLLQESVSMAVEARRKAEIAADNAEEAAKKVSETAHVSNMKDSKLWTTWATTTATETKIDTLKASHVVLKTTKKFWEEVDEAINLEKSFQKSISRPAAALKTSTLATIVSFAMGCIIITINESYKTENNSYYLIFISGCALIMGSVLAGIVKIVSYCAEEENDEEQMIRQNLKFAAERLRAYDEYFKANSITPVVSASQSTATSSEDEAAVSRASEETPLIGSEEK